MNNFDNDLYRDALVLTSAHYAKDVAKKYLHDHETSHHKLTHVHQTKSESSPDGLNYIIARSSFEKRADTNVIYLSVHGKISLKAWNESIWTDGENENNHDKLEGRKGKIPNGYWSLAEKLPLVFLQEEVRKGTMVVLTGHSIGGAVAAVAALILMGRATFQKDKIKCITFGSPMFVNDLIAEEMRTRNEEKAFHHFLCKDDLAPRLLHNPSLKNKEATMRFFSRLFLDYSEEGINSFLNNIRHLSPVGKYSILENVHTTKALLNDLNREVANTFLTSQVTEFRGENIDQYLQSHQMTQYSKMMEILFPSTMRCGECHHCQFDEEFKRYYGNDELKPMMMNPVIKSNELRIGIQNKVEDKHVICVRIVGFHLESLEPIIEGDLDIENATITEVREIKRTTQHMMYQVTAEGLHTKEELPLMSLSFRSRLPVELPNLSPKKIQKSFFPTREARIRDGGLIETIIDLRHLMADHKQETGRDEMHKQIGQLDQWLNQSLTLLTNEQMVFLKGVINSINQGREIDNLTHRVLSSLNGGTKKILEAQKSIVDETQINNLFKNPKEISNSNIKDFLLHGIQSQKNTNSSSSKNQCTVISTLPSSVKKLNILISVAFGVVFKNLLEEGYKSSVLVKNIKTSIVLLLSAAAVSALAVYYSPVIAWYCLIINDFDIIIAGDLLCHSLVTVMTTAGIVTLPFNIYHMNRAYFSSEILESSVVSLFQVPSNDSDLLSREEAIMGWIESSDKEDEKWLNNTNNEYIKKITGDSRVKIIEFIEGFCGPAVQLRKTALERKVFNIGFVGQPGAGKSTICSSNKGKLFRFEDKVKYKKETSVPLQYTVSNNIMVTDYPGMLGQGDEYSGAKLDVFRNAVPTLDVVIIVVKAYDRNYDVSKILELTYDKPVYVCITHADSAFLVPEYDDRLQDYLDRLDDAGDDTSNGDDDVLSYPEIDIRRGIVNDLVTWINTSFCAKHKVNPNDTHLVIPWKLLEKKDYIHFINASSPDSPFKTLDHLAQWLQMQALRNNIAEEEVRKYIPGPTRAIQ